MTEGDRDMEEDAIIKYAAENCRYRKFKWHTEYMCDNCRKVAEDIRKICDGIVKQRGKERDKEIVGIVESTSHSCIKAEKAGAGFFDFMTGSSKRAADAIENACKSIIHRIKL